MNTEPHLISSTYINQLWQIIHDIALSNTEKIQKILTSSTVQLDMDAVFIATPLEENKLNVLFFYEKDDYNLEEDNPREHSCQVLFQNKALFLDKQTLASLILPSQCFLIKSQPVQKLIVHPIYLQNELHSYLILVDYKNDIFSKITKNLVDLIIHWLTYTFYQQKQLASLEKYAWYDGLTGLLNRRAADIKLEDALKEANIQQIRFAVAICDIDFFKLVNDRYGHDVGDQVLTYVSNELNTSLRSGDWMARWGGEEFLIFLNRVDLVQSILALERLRKHIAQKKIPTSSGPIEVTLSMGVSPWRESIQSIDELLTEADEGLYAAKHTGRNRIVSGTDVQDGSLFKTALLKQALHKKNIFPVRQIIVDLKNNHKIVADESLARLRIEEEKVVTAREFLNIADAIQFTHEIDKQIIEKTLQYYFEYHDNIPQEELNRYHMLNISVNYLAKREWVEKLLLSCKYFCLKFNCIYKPWILSLTERQSIRDIMQIKRDTLPLIKAGFQLALDDFGSGSSSFLYLAHLPVNFIKIESWMIQTLDSVKTRKLLKGIVSLAKSQNIITIAKHVEDYETAEKLSEIGIDWAQGYFFGKPEIFLEED